MNPQPQQEYIITEEQLDHFVTCATHDDCAGCKYSAPEFSCVPRIMANKVRSRPHTPAPANPCEENGCTDIENCDEICEHMQIYSPAYVREKTRKARERVVCAILTRITEAQHDKSTMQDFINYVDSLRQQAGERE